MKDQRHTDVIIIGGGIIGCSIAFYLSRKGVNCFVFDASEVGKEASLAAAGILGAMMETDAPGPLVDLCLASQKKYPALANVLLEETGIDVEYIDSGLVGVARNESEEQELYKKWKWATSLGQQVEWLPEGELQKTEPLLSKELMGGLWIPHDHQVNNEKVTQAFRIAAATRGTQFFEKHPVFRLVTQDERVIGVETAAGQYTADTVVLAAGSWSEALVKPLGLSLSVYPVKGQCFSARLSSSVLRKSVFAQKCYLIPKRDGTIVVGATQEEVGFHKEERIEAVKSLYDIAVTMVPAMKDATFIKTWAGFRPGNPNIKPILGFVNGWQNLILATGHFRKGILLAPITGEIVSNMITGEESPVDWRPFALESHQNTNTIIV
ncbi:glycine oxidase ThiO [Fodinisporobacter ferrooxydans]|uniref:glycine oxidase n=1 Tax=Fodinisporobacter ferrooxydans TaxID=2901836 RepID=A0ABY4CMY9_9BACL|nr:glycine oxidase ThiO [Alicyclobacillaceae bacterium MYW30-H2]